MRANQKKFRFIPYRRQDIVDMCIQDNIMTEDIDNFRQLSHMLDQIFHFEFHQVIEALKNAYAGIDPDSDTLRPGFHDTQADESFVGLLDGLLEKANYQRITQADLNRAMSESSLFKISLHVEFNDFSEVSLFARGESVKVETVSSWFGLRKKSIEFVNYERVVVYIRMRDDFEHTKHDFAGCRAGATLLKLFRNVPKADLEMLFPNTRVRMRLMDKLLIGVPALVSGGLVLTTKLSASLVLLGSLFGYWFGVSKQQPAEFNQASVMALLAGVAALAGYLWKQFSNFKNRKIRFMQALTKNLYFKNLDNNAGVFHRLANDAEEEESKEAILAYYFLLTSDEALTKAELDKKIERWFESRWNCAIDFEIDDALHKLHTLGLVDTSIEKLSVVSIDQGIRILDHRWDNYFIAEI
jgi:hypothetical protein